MRTSLGMEAYTTALHAAMVWDALEKLDKDANNKPNWESWNFIILIVYRLIARNGFGKSQTSKPSSETRAA